MPGPMRGAIISGPPMNCQRAKEMVEQMVAEVEYRTMTYIIHTCTVQVWRMKQYVLVFEPLYCCCNV